MRRFLRETWELFYWALWCPSRLQQRMNEWAPAPEEKGVRTDTGFVDILLSRINGRFVSQFLLITVCLSFSIIPSIQQQPGAIDWLLLPVAWLVTYGIAVWSLPVALSFPMLLALSYSTQPDLWLQAIQEAQALIPPFPVLIRGLGVGGVGLGLTSGSVYSLLHRKQLRAARIIMVIGSSLSLAIGTGMITQNSGVAIVLLLLTGLSSAAVSNAIKADEDAKGVALFVAVVVAFVVAGVVAGVVAFVVAVGVAGLALAPLPLFCLFSILLGLSFAPIRGRFGGVWLGGVMLLLGFETLGFQAFWSIPAACVGYYRFLPDQILLSLFQIPFSLPWLRRSLRSQTYPQLQRLPPYTSELLWLPLPGHAQLLIDAFQTDPQTALPIFQHIQTFDLYGFQQTLRNALPQILANQLAAIDTTADLQSIADAHPLLSQLVPNLYTTEGDLPKVKLPLDVAVLFPKFQTLARDVTSALEASNIALRERGLERLSRELTLLSSQLPGLGLRPRLIKRWQPVITRWQRILELELEAQRQQSQGELPNPFTFGNPLRNRAELFKGRRAFVDEVYRLVLDRNRPTLVLHGPRRCGKSSFLLNLNRLLPSDLIPVYVDLQRAGMTSSEADFCYGLLRAIVRDCRSQNIQLNPLPSRPDFYANAYPLMEDWLDDALPSLGQRRLLLTLDEFEKIGTALQEQRLSMRLFDELRSLIQHTDQLAFLFSGVQTLDELGPNWSSYFISVVPMEMLYLEPPEAEDLMLNPDPDFGLDYEGGTIEEILRLSRCQPYLLQLLGSALVTQANLEHTQTVTPSLLQAALNSALTQGEPYFTNVWTEFTGTTPADIAAGQAYLLSLVGKHSPPDPTQPATQAAIRRLRRYHVIESIAATAEDPRTDRIEIPLIEKWVTERAVISN